MKSWVRNRGLLLANLGLFLVFFAGMAVSGWSVYNSNQSEHGQPEVSFGSYLRTGEFGEATFENWESEFLQMGSYVLLTAYLVQRGSSESKKLDDAPQDEDPRLHRDDPDAPWPVHRGGWVLKLYENSLALAFAVLFLGSWLGHAITGAKAYSDEELQHGGSPVTTWEYLGTSQFWFESMQNWQSEFLAVASIVGLSVYLRQRGSAESKPVAAPHAETGA
ncbi:MAG: hypothetical protein QOF52_59 [Propionibacteriaceae bacterium]|nr:hypothetical protein [Propionibacteriaceae bacterium]